MDEVDRANDTAQADLERTLAAHHQLTMTRPGAQRTECEDCGAPIPRARQVAVPGCVLCVDCQIREDRKSERFW